MKIFLSLGLALSALVPAQAQIFHPAAVNGAVLGGIAGAIIGGTHHDAWQGAAIGATTGLIVGSIADSTHYHDVWYGSGAPGPRVYSYGPAYRHYPAAGGYYYYSRAGYHTHGFYHGHAGYYNPWYGAVVGASLGYLVGSIVDDHAHYQEAAAAVPVAAPAPAPQQPVTIINNYYNSPATPMTAANALFGR